MATPLINGINGAWNDVTVTANGRILVGITAITYNVKQKKENNYGAGAEPVSRGYGAKEYDGGEMELYLEEWKKFIADSPDGDPLLESPFDIAVTFGDSESAIKKDVLTMCEFTENNMTTKQGDTKIMVKVPFVFAGISR